MEIIEMILCKKCTFCKFLLVFSSTTTVPPPVYLRIKVTLSLRTKVIASYDTYYFISRYIWRWCVRDYFHGYNQQCRQKLHIIYNASKLLRSFTAAFLTWIQLQYSRARELFQKILVQLRCPWILHWIWTLANSWRSYNQSWQKLNNEWMRRFTFPTVIGQLLSVRANIGSYFVANNSLRTWWQSN